MGRRRLARRVADACTGASHFLEHLLFKGTAERSALDISVALDAVGGEFNAFTAKEYTCFHARVLDEDLPLAVDVLGDMVTVLAITAEDVEAEREVILDEIAMHDDDPDDVVHNLFAEQAWGDSPLGRPIAGTVESITALTRDADRGASTGATTAPANMVVAVAGNVDHAASYARCARRSAATASSTATRPPVPPRRGAERVAGSRPATSRRRRPFEQVNLVLGVNGPDPHRRPPLRPRRAQHRARRRHVVAGCSRRSASAAGWPTRSSPSPATTPTPAWSASPSAACRASSTTCSPWSAPSSAKVADDGITDEELARGKGQLRGGLVLGLEDSGSRMSRLGKAELVYDELLEHRRGARPHRRGHPRGRPRRSPRELFSQPEMLAVVGPALRRGLARRRAAAARSASRRRPPAQAAAHSTLVKVPMMNRSAAPVRTPPRPRSSG